MPGFTINGTGGGPSGVIEAARSNRWKVAILDDTQLNLVAHTCNRPTPEISPITMHHGQNEIYLPGKHRWSPVEIKFYEVVVGHKSNVTAEIYRWWSKDVIDVDNNVINRKAKKTVNIEMLDGFGVTIWKYKLIGAWPEKITPDAMDYGSSNILEIAITLRYDAAMEILPPPPPPPKRENNAWV